MSEPAMKHVGAQKVPRQIARTRGRLKSQFDAGFQAPEMFTCQPQGPADTRLKTRLENVERLLTTVAEHQSGLGFVVGEFDKARQNPINNLARRKGGDAVILLTREFIERAVGLIMGVNAKHGMSAEIDRVSATSDEVKIVLMGRNLPKDMKLVFDEAWRILRQNCNLRERKYTVTAGYNGRMEEFQLDLEAFSRILKHPGILDDPSRRDDLLLSYHLHFSKPQLVKPSLKRGFVLDAFRELENEQVAFRRYLPASFRVNGGLAEVQSEFKMNVTAMFTDQEREGKRDRMEGGTFVEIKLSPRDKRDIAALIPFISDGWGDRYGIQNTHGTRKGWAEVYSGRGGVRVFNTFPGYAGANYVMTPVVQAMWELNQIFGVEVMPISSSYLQYWVNLPPTELTRRMICNAVRGRMEKFGSDDYAVRRLDPSLVMLDATEMTVSDVRAKFILASMNEGKEVWPAEMLERADFILNFVENVNRKVQMSIFESLAKTENGGQPIKSVDLEYINYIRWICSQRRTIRDTEDLVWVLRKDENLPDEIKAERKNIERWIFDFAQERGERVFYLLTRWIEKEMKNRK